MARREWIIFYLLFILRIWVSSGKRKRLVNKMQGDEVDDGHDDARQLFDAGSVCVSA